MLNRRALLGGLAGAALGSAGELSAACPPNPLTVCNFSHLNSVTMAQIVPVHDAQDLRQALRRWQGRVSIGGGRFSMGGQTALAGGLQLDLRPLRQLVYFDPDRKVVRVQAGMRWRDLQALIDPHGLAVRTMQSYANFTVGGSVSVNCHGRYVGHGAIVGSLRALQLVLADGEVLETSPARHSELFFAAIGAYGGVGVITEVELALDDNFPIERHQVRVPLEDYPSWFRQAVANDPSALLHNADLLPGRFDLPHCVTWRRSATALTEPARLRPLQARYSKEKTAIWAMTELPGGAALRRNVIEPMQSQAAVVWRNHEASRDVAELEPATRSIATYLLQEYFIPERQFVAFARRLAALLQRSPQGTLNVSIRHAPADQQSLLAWAREPVFCFVLFHKQRIGPEGQRLAAAWTQALTDLALAHQGSYYLPYAMHASQSQFDAAYPQAKTLRALRQSLGATRFSNALWERYRV